jgi:hypothetical protein
VASNARVARQSCASRTGPAVLASHRAGAQ